MYISLFLEYSIMPYCKFKKTFGFEIIQFKTQTTELSIAKQCGLAKTVVQSLSHVQLIVTPWTTAHQASCPSPSPRFCSNSCPLSQ